MDRVFDPPMTHEELRGLALHYVYHQLARKTNATIDYAPQWVKLAHEQDRLIVLDTDCDCGGDNHHVSFGIEWDDEYDQPHISLWAKLFCWHDTTRAWSDAFQNRRDKIAGKEWTRWDDLVVWFTKIPGVMQHWKRRFTSACKLFFTGYAEWEGGITFKNEKHIEDLHLALWWAQFQVTETGREWRKKHMDRYKNMVPSINVDEWMRWAEMHPDEVSKFLAAKSVDLYNMVTDDGINKELVKQGFNLPPDSCKWSGKTAEEIYRLLVAASPKTEDDDVPVAPV